MRSTGTAHELERRRLLALRRVRQGWAQTDVADFLGVTPRTVSRWVTTARQHGEAALQARPHPGRPPRLTAGQQRQVLAWLQSQPTAFGFATDLWTAPRVAALIEQRFGVRYHPRYLNAWLTRRGVTPQKPARPAKERDQEAIDRWVADDWPRIQKKSRKRRPTSC